MYLVLITLGFIVLCAIVLPKSNHKPHIMIDETAQIAVNTYNNYCDKIQSISNVFISSLNKIQREIMLNQDGYSHQKCVYLVDEFNTTSDILESKLKEASNCINNKQYRTAIQMLSYLDKELDYLKSLIKTLGEIKIEPHSFDNVFGNTNESISEQEEKKPMSYFSDCKSREELITRYRALAKVFHPDAKSGNEKLFREVKEEFDSILPTFPRT